MNDIKCPKCGEVFKVDQAGYADIAKQVRDQEFAQALKERLEQANQVKQSELQLAQAAKDQEIAVLQAALAAKATETELEVTKAKAEVANQKDLELKAVQAELERYRDFKLKLSTKMVGETLEEHCKTEFNKIRAAGFTRAYFEKDNEVVEGSKGDYIFKDFDEEGNEFISIMFEMKNENDATEKKKKNEDFFKELDKDRTAKGCEYAVLVSVLEAEDDFYNKGIVDVSHKYPKMYVVRPNFFLPILTLLRNAAQSTASTKAELARMKDENLDITNFERDLLNFHNAFNHKFQYAGKKFEEAIDGIDKTITQLEKVKKALLASERNLQLAKNKIEDVSIKKLTRGNPTMTARFKELPPLDPDTLEKFEDFVDEEDE